MGELHLSETQLRVPDTQIGGIVFGRGIEILLPFEIETLGFLEQERILEMIEVLRNGHAANVHMLAAERIGESVRIGQRAYRRRDHAEFINKIAQSSYLKQTA